MQQNPRKTHQAIKPKDNPQTTLEDHQRGRYKEPKGSLTTSANEASNSTESRGCLCGKKPPSAPKFHQSY